MAEMITDAQVAALRAFLIHDTDQMGPLAYRLGNEGIRGYIYLAEAALSITARNHFAPRFSDADLVRYIADVRASRTADGVQFDFDPVAGEEVLRHSLGQLPVHALELEAHLRATIAILDALADNEFSSEADLNLLLDQAHDLADRRLAQESVRAVPDGRQH
jgi:hypothetical protein